MATDMFETTYGKTITIKPVENGFIITSDFNQWVYTSLKSAMAALETALQKAKEDLCIK